MTRRATGPSASASVVMRLWISKKQVVSWQQSVVRKSSSRSGRRRKAIRKRGQEIKEKKNGKQAAREISKRSGSGADERVVFGQQDGGAEAAQDRHQHGRGRCDAEPEADGPGGERAGPDRRPEAGGDAGEEVHRGLQSPRRHGHGVEVDAARR